MEIIAQIIGIIAMIVGALSLAQKNTKTILFIQIFSTALFGITVLVKYFVVFT